YLHYKVALEQADGLNHLANSVGNDGDAGDVYPNHIALNYEFHEYSTPNSLPYSGSISQVGVWNISASDSVMTADLDVTYSRPWIQAVTAEPFTLVDFDGDDIIEAGESVEMYFKINNVWLPSVNVTATLTSTNSEINFTQQTVNIAGPLNSAQFENASDPITFTVPSSINPSIDSFFVTITTDSINGVPGNAPQFTRTFSFEAEIGQPNVLIMDDDRGDTLETLFTNSFYNKRVPSDTWDVNSSGLPNLLDLSQYDMVFWHTGDSSSNVIDASKIALMKQIMDAGKSMLLSTTGGISDIDGLDSAFLADYFKVAVDNEIQWPLYNGVSNNPVTDGFLLRPATGYFYFLPTFIALTDGEVALTTGASNDAIISVTYDGTNYKSMITSLPIEIIEDRVAGYNTKAELLSKVFDFFGGLSTSVYDDSNPFSRLPKSFQLSQNYPNPFNPVTTINYTIHPSDQIGANTRLEVFNLLGRRVKTLVDKAQIPGDYTVQWDGKNEQNQPVSSGIYFYRLSRGTEIASKKMTLLK
ncbi:MAG: T9SS C-terminal target domain-containing protein, partial [Calditrichaeota bacterium]